MKLDDDLLTFDQAAAFLGLSRNTVRAYTYRGDFPVALRVGRTVLLSKKALKKIPRNPVGNPGRRGCKRRKAL